MFDLEPGMIIWTWITFLAVFFLLFFTVLKPMLRAINNREEGIREDLDAARRQREEAQMMLEQHHKLLVDAEVAGQKIAEENLKLAEKTRQEIMENAREEADRIIALARESIEKQKKEAIASLREEVADMAVNAAEHIIVQTLDKEKNKKVIDEYLKSIPPTFTN
jgi:F-type H+-transporting ATPase subunit b